VKKYRLQVEVEPLENGRFLATAPKLRGCLAEGETIAEALENVEDVARLLIEMSIKEGLPLPPELLGDDSHPVVKAEVVVQVGT
jgi:predicted RNase H-like HicB family nuclease